MLIKIKNILYKFRHSILTQSILVIQLSIAFYEFYLSYDNWSTALCLNYYESIRALTGIRIAVIILLIFFIAIQLLILSYYKRYTNYFNIYFSYFMNYFNLRELESDKVLF